MSVRILSKVFAYSKAEANTLLVLISLADFANDKGCAFPSMDTLARKARVSERTAQRAVADLVEMGELAISRQAARRGCNLFWVTIEAPPETRGGDKNDGGDKLSGVTKATQGGDKNDGRGRQKRQKGVTRVTPEPSENRQRTVIEPPEARERANGVQVELGVARGPAPNPAAEIPPGWSPELRQAWADWVEHRRQSGKPLTAVARRLQIAQLNRWTDAEAITNIHHAITSGWQGINPAGMAPSRRGGLPREGEYTDSFS